MVNIDKVTQDIKEDGKYDALLDTVKFTLDKDNPTFDEIKDLVQNDSSIIVEYKDLNRWGELSSVHVNELYINSEDIDEAKSLKEKINKNVTYLKNGEEYEIKQKNVIYLAWTGFIALPSIYVIDNIVRITGLYDGNENSVFISFAIVIITSIWGYFKVTKNHKNQHERYLKTQIETKMMIKDALDKNYITSEEVYQQ